MKKVNDVTRLQTLVDKKKVIITEATIRDALRLNDEEGIDCLPNEEIFTELSRMGNEKPFTKLTFNKEFFSSQWLFLIHTILQCMSAKRTSWNEFSSSMASAVICLSIGKKFNFSKYDSGITIGEVAAKVNVDDVRAAGVADEGAASVNINDVHALLMNHLFHHLHHLLNHHHHHKIYLPLHKRVKNLEQDKIAQTLEITKLKQRVKKLEMMNKLKGEIIASIDADEDVTLQDVANIAKEVDVDAEIEKSAYVQGRQAKSQAQIYQIDLEHADNVLSMQDDELEPTELQEVVEVATTAKLMTKVITAASATITVVDTTAAPTLTTAAAPTLTTAPSTARRRKGVVVRDPEETATPSTIIYTEPKSKDKGKGIMVHEPKPLKKKTQIEQDEAYVRELEAELNKNIDWDEVIDKVKRKEKEVNDVMRYQALKKRPQTEAQARKNMMIYLRNMVGFKMDYFKGMTYDICPIFEKKFNSNMAFLERTKEKIEEEDSRAHKRISESQEDKATIKKKLDEEVEELRKNLQIVPNDDDVYTEATPLALKIPVVDYEIYTENNKLYYKIKRADETHQLYLSFLSMLRNFDREDLEVLWQLVKERFTSSKPKNF
nr:ribonuclease H-like domain-containing protein [Tanacetum cinerariifolium]